MTNLAEQVNEFQNSWLEQQQQLVQECQATLKNATATVVSGDTWCQTINMMEQQVNSMLDSQQRSLTSMVKIMEQVGNPAFDLHQWEHQVIENLELWIDTQQKLWGVWFEVLRHTPTGNQTLDDDLINSWKEFIDRTADIQQQWLSCWPNEKP